MSEPHKGHDDASPSETFQLGKTGIKVSRQGIGITLQGSTLLALLGLGFQFKGAMDDQLEEIARARIEIDQRTANVERQLASLASQVNLATMSSEQVVSLQLEQAKARGDVSLHSTRIEKLERALDDLEETVARLRRGGR